jgi:hypothetical protein
LGPVPEFLNIGSPQSTAKSGLAAAFVCTSKNLSFFQYTPLGVYSTEASLAVMAVFCYPNAIVMLNGDILKSNQKEMLALVSFISNSLRVPNFWATQLQVERSR